MVWASFAAGYAARQPLRFWRSAQRGEMKLTIDNLNGLGETDYSALLDAERHRKSCGS